MSDAIVTNTNTNTELERPEVTETGLLAERTERLAPLYAASIQTFTWGFRIGAALLALGLVVTLAKGERLSHEAAPVGEVLAKVLAGSASGIIELAILWFMITPVVTVIVVAVSFWRLRDRRYAALSLVVLAILGASIALALNR
jgi:uncharacterized membrane protein